LFSLSPTIKKAVKIQKNPLQLLKVCKRFVVFALYKIKTMQSKLNKSAHRAIVQELNKAIASFMGNNTDDAYIRLEALDKAKISPQAQGQVQKVFLLLLAGSLYDLATLKEILSLYGIKSNNYSKILQKLSHNQVYDVFMYSARTIFKTEFIKLLAQSGSSQSRAEITIVGDDSTFRQWLINAENDPFYGPFFSGQFKHTVSGFCVSLVGCVLSGTFYPLSFRLIPKTQPQPTKEKDNKEANDKTVKKERKKSLVEFEKGLKDVHDYITQLSKEAQQELPQLYVSIDSGFNNKELLDYCQTLEMITISVAVSSEILFYNEQRMNFQTLTETVFLPKELKYFNTLNEKTDNEANKLDKKPFLLRLKVFYQKLQRFVTILMFRLKGSKKVTIIFCYDKNVKAKTMRRHFFQRTQIEQFFRMVKHTLHIEQSTSDGYQSFIKKVAIFFLKAIFAFTFRNYCRKHIRRFKTYSFYKLRKNIVHHNADKTILIDLL
jgi:hypothetical protein